MYPQRPMFSRSPEDFKHRNRHLIVPVPLLKQYRPSCHRLSGRCFLRLPSINTIRSAPSRFEARSLLSCVRGITIENQEIITDISMSSGWSRCSAIRTLGQVYEHCINQQRQYGANDLVSRFFTLHSALVGFLNLNWENTQVVSPTKARSILFEVADSVVEGIGSSPSSTRNFLYATFIRAVACIIRMDLPGSASQYTRPFDNGIPLYAALRVAGLSRKEIQTALSHNKSH